MSSNKNADYARRTSRCCKFVFKFAEDLLIIGGLMLIIGASYKINAIFGQYVLGFVLLWIGFIIANK